MVCSICGDQVDDPFWDEYCPECDHNLFHGGEGWDVSCGFCLADAERDSDNLHDDFDYGYDRSYAG